MKIKNKRGFTFIEIIVGMIVLLIGIAGVMGLVFWGRLVLKHSENKALAMNVAYSKMEEYLAKSYSGLGTNHEAGTTPNSIDWEVNVFQEYEDGNTTPLSNPPPGHTYVRIPYKKIEVTAYYQEENPGQQNTYIKKAIKLVNLVPYPFMHAQNKLLGPDLAALVPYGTDSHAYTAVGSGGNSLGFVVNYETPKEFLIIYNIALNIDVDFADGLGPDAAGNIPTIYTGIFVDGFGPDKTRPEPYPVETRTPILTQPLISNVTGLTGIKSLAPGPHRIEVKWYKDTKNGKITLRNGDLIIIATEKK